MTGRTKNLAGVVTLTKALTAHELWACDEPYCRRAAWLFLLLKANDSPRTFQKRTGDVVSVERGQLAWSIQSLAAEWRWSKEKVSGFLKYLERIGCIRCQSTARGSVITVVNYDTYNPPESDTDRTLIGHSPEAEPTTDAPLVGQQTSTELGSGNRKGELGSRKTHRAGAGDPEPDTDAWKPTLEEFVAWGESWPGCPAVGAPAGIPIAWLEGWFAAELRRSDGFVNWKKRAEINFRTDWREGRPRALGMVADHHAEPDKKNGGSPGWTAADLIGGR